jgi:hypothetical protein
MMRSLGYVSVLTKLRQFAVAASALCCLASGFAQTTENEAESKNCTKQILACGVSLGAIVPAALNASHACKPLRECKKEVRQEKRECKKDARSDKKDCKAECRAKFGSGKDYRDCAKSCRDDKHESKDECKETKKEEIDVCRDTFKTPACTDARKLFGGAAAAGIPSCATATSCIAANSSEPQ